MDFAVSLLVFIYSSPGNTRTEYSSVSTPVLLALTSIPFLVYGVSVALRTILWRQRMSVFEMVQTMIAFLLAFCGVISIGLGEYNVAIGIVCVALSAAGYAVVFTLFDASSLLLNYQVYSAWSAGLFLLGSFLCLPRPWLSMWFGCAAVTAMLISTKLSRLTLEYHCILYLVAAAFFSGLLRFTGRSLIGSLTTTPSWSFGAIFSFAILCYLLHGRSLKNHWTERLPHLATAVLTAASGTALVVSMLAVLMRHINSIKTNPLEFIQTFAVCSAALALAYFGSHRQRTELSWIAYSALVFVAAKLLFEDLRHGHLVLIAASFFLYAATLILLPRMASGDQQNQASKAIES